MVRRLVLEVRGCDEYLRFTLRSWLEFVKDLLESEYEVELEIRESPVCRDADVELHADGELVMEGLPGEEGYLVEVLKKLFEELKVKSRSTSSSETLP